MWILKLKSVNSEVKSVDSEAKKCGFVKNNSYFFYCLLPKVWFKARETTTKCEFVNQKITRSSASYFLIHKSTLSCDLSYTES